MKYTNQSAFTKMVQHLRKQGHRAYDEVERQCQYRTSCGDMCAVGALIPDDQYERNIESLAIGEIYEDFPIFENVSLLLLADMQAMHDGFEPEDWEQQIEVIAEGYDLTVPPMETK